MKLFEFHAFPVSEVLGTRVLLMALCLLILGFLPSYGSQTPPVKVAIIVSRHIGPYLEAVEGLESVLSDHSGIESQIFRLEKLDAEEQKQLFGRKGEKEFSIFIAVGPAAAFTVWKATGKQEARTLYLMVLNPGKVIGGKRTNCGISLNIPVQTQVEMIRQGLPGAKRLGLLYDPEHNADFFRRAEVFASALELEVIPLRVSSKKEIPSALARHWDNMNAIWLIPDRTVISESIVKFVSKEAFLRKIPLIGYNRFFYETGAALAFVFNYRSLGEQCAHKVLRILSGENCQSTPPRFEVWINKRVVEKLGLKHPDEYLSPIQIGP
ncbi:MAG: ABC transporter substrate binding protein [Deltaproteobacteria bacterium]|nr:ABC transporter substrate binding protein [Deltaproteobacteria bacterium]